jgi:hypothetical protein
MRVRAPVVLFMRNALVVVASVENTNCPDGEIATPLAAAVYVVCVPRAPVL